MAITFNTNLAALGTQRSLGIASGKTASSLAKLSSGSRVPTAKDDAAGLAVGTQLRAEVAGLNQASLNASQAISVLQIADGALSTVSDILTRMKSLAVQAASGQLSDNDRGLLNAEYVNLRGEIDRIAGITSFNGTSLLAGSTQVSSFLNGLSSFNGSTNDTSYASLLTPARGFTSVAFAQDFGDGAIKIGYDSTGTNQGNMIVKNLVTGVSQTITVEAAAIATGETETLSFGEVGVTITLNSNFNKSADLAASNDARWTAAASATAYGATASGNAGALVFDTTPAVIQAIAFTDNSGGALGTSRLYGSDLAGTLTVANTSTKDGVTFDDFTLTVDGITHTFKQTSAAQDFESTGNKDFVFDDSQGNTFTLRLDVVTTATADADVTGVQVVLAAGSTGGAIENTGTAFVGTRPTITAVTEATTEGSRFNFGTVDNARLMIDGTAANASVITLVVNGQTFSSANTTGGASGNADLSSTGMKTVTLANTNVAATANTITVQFNVTQAFVNGTVSEIGLGDLGQIAGADSLTSGTTSFSFKVGTGSTASSANNDISFNLSSATTNALGIDSSAIDTSVNANSAIDLLTDAINVVSTARANVGANQSRLDFAKNSVDVTIQNTTAAQSGLLDVDVSAEITNFTSQQVLLQAGVSLLAQANQQPALLLRLLQ